MVETETQVNRNEDGSVEFEYAEGYPWQREYRITLGAPYGTRVERRIGDAVVWQNITHSGDALIRLLHEQCGFRALLAEAIMALDGPEVK